MVKGGLSIGGETGSATPEIEETGVEFNLRPPGSAAPPDGEWLRTCPAWGKGTRVGPSQEFSCDATRSEFRGAPVSMTTFSIQYLSLLIVVGLISGCTQSGREADSAAVTNTLDLGQRLEWSAVDGAVEYRVQLWSRTRLLFEELREQPALPITAAMERSLLGVDLAEMQVRAYAADGAMIGEVQRQEFRTLAE